MSNSFSLLFSLLALCLLASQLGCASSVDITEDVSSEDVHELRRLLHSSLSRHISSAYSSEELLSAQALLERPRFEKRISLTEKTELVGLQLDTFEAYLGIPYAQPPVDDLRWVEPQPVAYNSTVNATRLAPACPQIATTPLPDGWYNEDCLYLNVWKPITEATDLPVMVYIHGGGWTSGSGSLALYYGDYVASLGDVIIVTFNYRLGALGFLVTEDFAGNYGYLDQRQVLLWVQQYIASFGGNPDSVTLLGQSAGGISVATHLTSPTSAGLFSQTMIQSGPTLLTYRTQEGSYGYGDQFASNVGCNTTDIGCLRSASVEEVLTAQSETLPEIGSFPWVLNDFFAYMPVIDGVNIIDSPQTLINENKTQPGVGCVWGNTRNETAGWIYNTLPNLPIPPVLYKALLTAFFGVRGGEKVFNKYPAHNASEVRYQLSQFSCDWAFTCSMRYNSAVMASNSIPIYRYLFMHPPSTDPRATGTVAHCANIQEVCHGAEVDYVYHSASYAGANFTTEESQLSLDTLGWWTDYAKEQLKWPLYDPSTDNSFAIDLPESYVLNDFREEFCDFWQNKMQAYNM